MSSGPTKAQFEAIYRDGKRVQGEFCRVMALPGTGKIGFATPRALGNTPRRNRLKRRFRAAVSNMERPPELDLVIAISAQADQKPYDQIRTDLARTIKRIADRWANDSDSSS